MTRAARSTPQDLVLRAACFGLLLALAGISLRFPGQQVSPGMLMGGLCIYAHAAARILGAKGTAKGLLFLQVWPFLVYGLVRFSWLAPLQAGFLGFAALVAGSALLMGEAVWTRGMPTLTSSTGFIAASVLAGLGLAWVPVGTFLGLTTLLAVAMGYILVRRGRA